MESLCRYFVLAVFVFVAAHLLFTGTTHAVPTTLGPADELVNTDMTTSPTLNFTEANGTTVVIETSPAEQNQTNTTTFTTASTEVVTNSTKDNLTTRKGTTKASDPTSKNPTPKPKSGDDGGFDTASFIGGIVLATGVIGIAVFGYKFYKSRQDKNYQTF